MIQVLKLNSDNYENQLITQDAYEALKLEMSTGDFACHKVEPVTVKDFKGVLTKEELFGILPENFQDMYSESVLVLKQFRKNDFEGVVLYKQSELRYFKNGRANMHVRVSYHVQTLFGTMSQSGTHWIKTKAEAIKLFNQAVKACK